MKTLTNEESISWMMTYGIDIDSVSSSGWFDKPQSCLRWKVIPYYFGSYFENSPLLLYWKSWGVYFGSGGETRIRNAYLRSLGLKELAGSEPVGICSDEKERELLFDLFYLSVMSEDDAFLISQSGNILGVDHHNKMFISLIDRSEERDQIQKWSSFVD